MQYQTAPNSKPGHKRGLTLMQKLITTLIRPRIALMGRQLTDTFSVSQKGYRQEDRSKGVVLTIS